MLIHAIPSSSFKNHRIYLLCAVLAILTPWVISQGNSSSTEVVTVIAENATDSAAQESTVRTRRVRNNLIRYGAIYRGNSTRSARAFTSRPKVSRRNKHRHSTRVDTTKLPIVLLPPVLTISRRSDDIEIEKHEPFVINVVSSEQPTTFTSSPTQPFTLDEQRTSPHTIDRSSSKPYVDNKIMAMKNFGVRMKSSGDKFWRGEIKFRSTTPVAASTSHVLNDYTPPPKYFATEEKLQKVKSQPTRRRFRGRTTTAAPETTTPLVLPRENTYYEFQSHDANDYSELNFDNLNSLSASSTLPPISDFTNSSLSEVLNYDIQRTSPRTIFSLDATGPVESVSSVDNGDYNKGFLSDNSVTVSSPGTPTTHVDDFFSNIPEVSSSFVPRTEINVATSTSQFVENSTPSSSDGDFYLKDLLYPPLNVLTPPYLEDEYHDQQGNLLPNVTESNLNSTVVFVTPSSDVRSSVASDGISTVTEDSNASAQSSAPQAAYREGGDATQQQPTQQLNRQRSNSHTNTNRETESLPTHQQSRPQNNRSKYPVSSQGSLQNNQPFQQQTHEAFQQQQPHEAFQQQQPHEAFQQQQPHEAFQQQQPHEAFHQQHQLQEQRDHQPLQEPQSHDNFNGFVPYQDYFGGDHLSIPGPHQFFEPHQPLSQYTDCENGDCLKNQTFPNWTHVPISPSDIKVLSNEDSIELINKMYENLIRVLNGGPDYYDLSDEPRQNHIDLPKPERKPAPQKSHGASLQLAESGDIRNLKDRVQTPNDVPTRSRTSRRKDARGVHDKSVQKKPMVERKATQLCTSKTLTYVADVSTGCKVFYVCTEYGIGEPMLCPNGTLFNQDYLVCDWWYNVECS